MNLESYTVVICLLKVFIPWMLRLCSLLSEYKIAHYAYNQILCEVLIHIWYVYCVKLKSWMPASPLTWIHSLLKEHVWIFFDSIRSTELFFTVFTIWGIRAVRFLKEARQLESAVWRTVNYTEHCCTCMENYCANRESSFLHLIMSISPLCVAKM